MNQPTEFMQQIAEAPTDLHLVSLLNPLFSNSDMQIIVAALTRA